VFCTIRLSESPVTGTGHHGGARSIFTSSLRSKEKQIERPRIREIRSYKLVALLVII
jgi:hypothetical protein